MPATIKVAGNTYTVRGGVWSGPSDAVVRALGQLADAEPIGGWAPTLDGVLAERAARLLGAEVLEVAQASADEVLFGDE